MRVDQFVYEQSLCTLRLRDRAQVAAPGQKPLIVVARDYSVTFVVDDGDRQRLTVPAGLMFDGPSVPWWGRWAISPLGRHFEAALPHDFLYGHPGWNSRKYADLVFLAGMVAAHVPKWRRQMAYRAVRIGGRRRYKNGRNVIIKIRPEDQC